MTTEKIEEPTTTIVAAAPELTKAEAAKIYERSAFDATIGKIGENIETLRKKLDEVQKEIDTKTNREELAKRRDELRIEMSEVSEERKGLADKKNVLLDTLKKVNEDIKAKTDYLKKSKEKLTYKSTDEINRRIADMERQVESGQMKLIDEKRMLQDISKLKKSKNVFGEFDGKAALIEKDRAKANDLKAKMDEISPNIATLNKTREQIKKKLDALDKERNATHSKVKTLLDEKKRVKGEIDAEFNKRRELFAGLKKYRDSERAARAAAKARHLEFRRIRDLEDKKASLEKQLEKFKLPPNTKEIAQCTFLMNHFKVTYLGEEAVKTEEEEASGASTAAKPAFNIRKVDDALPQGLKQLTKKSDREEDFLMLGGGGGKKKGGKKQKAASASNKIKLSFAIMGGLGEIGVTVPATREQVPACVEAIATKQQHYRETAIEKKAANDKKYAEVEAKIAEVTLAIETPPPAKEEGKETKADAAATSTKTESKASEEATTVKAEEADTVVDKEATKASGETPAEK